MKEVTIWMAQDLDDPTGAAFALTAEKAEKIMARRYGYSTFDECIADGWGASAIEITVIEPVAAALLGSKLCGNQ